VRPPPDTERAIGSPRLAGLRRRSRRTYVEVWFGEDGGHGYASDVKASGHAYDARALAGGFAGYLDGHCCRTGVPRRRVRVYLREEPPVRGPFQWQRELPVAVREAVGLGDGFFWADWTPLEREDD